MNNSSKEQQPSGIPVLNQLKVLTKHPELNWYQQLFAGIQLPDSKGTPSTHITTLWYVGILPVLATVVAEIWRVATREKAEFAGGFWALISTLVTVVIAANSVKEYQIRKNKAAGPSIPKDPNPETQAPTLVGKKRYGKYAKKQQTTVEGSLSQRQLVLPKRKGEVDLGPT